MLYFQALILGIIQAATEFLPVSSSGHLVLLHSFFKDKTLDNLSFDIMLHFGTALALIIFFRQDILNILRGIFDKSNAFGRRLFGYLILAMIPAIVVGIFIEDYITLYLRNNVVIAISLIVGGVLFFVIEKISSKNIDFHNMKINHAFWIGLFQCLAFIPGVSRSGITIITGLSLNLKRETAARFSFLLGIPIILGAGLKDLISSYQQFSSKESLLYLIGFLASSISAYFIIKYFIRFLERHTLNIFGIYRIILGILILLLLLT